MRYYKLINEGYLISVGTGAGGNEITEDEYNILLDIILNKPTAESGYDYRLKADLTWELYELPPVEDPDEEIALEDALLKLRELGVEV